MQHPQPNNNYVQQPPFNTNYMQQPMKNLKDISNPTTAIDMALGLMAKAFKLNNTTPTNNNQRSSSNPHNLQIAQPGMNMDQDKQMLMVEDTVRNQFRPNAWQIVGNPNGYNAVQNVGNQLGHNAVQNLNIQNSANHSGNGNVVAERAEGNRNGNNENQIRCYNYQGVDHYARNCTVKPRKRDATYLQTQLHIAQKEEAVIQLNSEEFDFMAAASAYDEIEEVNANDTLKAILQQALTSGTQTNKARVYDSEAKLLEPISEPHQVQQNDSNVIFAVSSVEQSGGTVEQNPATIEETHAYFVSLYNILAIEVEKVNLVNRKIKETNVDLTT
ncbi:hypothetical protein Tco_1092447 [Tanacetum coccineum]|uniref:Gag-Pol polyprotein n=1 Tax=Tanacetum coccineum TaxID=301880 RepID=A0ABQ5IB65_9ASTR